MEFYAMDDAITSWIVVGEQYCGWHRVVHGGIINLGKPPAMPGRPAKFDSSGKIRKPPCL